MRVSSPLFKRTIIDEAEAAKVVSETARQVAEAAKLKPYGGKLCEGAEGSYATEVAYVVQEDKVFFAYGKDSSPGKALTESMEGSASIVESLNDLELYEDAEGKMQVKGGIWYVEGPAQRSDVINANKRIYGRKIWERLIANQKSPVQESIKARGMIGHLEHPKDGRTDGNLGAWVVVESKLLDDGVVWNRYELLDTPAGKIVQEYTRKGVRYGSSSRGNGDVGEDGRVNETNFMVETWDAVMRPSTPGAYPKPVAQKRTAKTEGAGNDASGEVMTEDAKACETQVLALVESSNEGLTESVGNLAGDLMEKLTEVRGLARSNAMSEDKADELQDKLMARLTETIKTPASATTVIDRTLKETDTGKDKREAAFSRVVESLKTRVQDSVTEAEDLRTKLHEAQEKLKTTSEELATVKAAHAESMAEAERLQAKLDVATEALTDLSVREAADPVKAGIEEAIAEVPGLSQHREALEEAGSEQELSQLLERLLPSLQEREPAPVRTITEAAKPSNRRSLPVGAAVVSEGITSGPGIGRTVVTGGAGIAARVAGRTAPAPT